MSYINYRNLILIIFLLSGYRVQSQIWQEDFSSYPNGTTTASDNQIPSGADWTRDISGATSIPPGYFSVQGQTFRARNTNGEVVWSSEIIDISMYSRVYISTDVSYTYTTGNDYVRLYYKIDGGPENLFGEFNDISILGGATINFGGYSLYGNNIQIIARIDAIDDLLLGIIQINAELSIDNIEVFDQQELYSIGSGNWSNGSVWSVTSGGSSCSCTPGGTDFVHIEGGYTINVNTDVTNSSLIVYNGSTLQWTTDATLNMLGGDLTVENGGALNRNGHTADISLNQSGTYDFSNYGTFNASSLIYNTNNISVNVNGSGTVYFNDDIFIERAGGVFGVPYTGEYLTNNGNLTINTNINLNDRFGTNGEITINNYGVIILNGVFTNIGASSSFINYSNAEWYYGGNTFDTNVQLSCDHGSNDFIYSRSGIQNVITPLDSYSNLTFSGSGSKSLQGNISVKRNISLDGTASLNSGTFAVTLNGTSVQDIQGQLNFYQLIINNSTTGDAITIDNSVVISNGLTLTDGIVNLSGGTLSLSASASITGGTTDVSFINGPIAYTGVGSATIYFPVGKNGKIHGASLTVNGPAVNYTAEYITGSAYALGYTLPGTIEGISSVGYWNIDNGSTGVTSAAVTLYFNVDDEVTDPSSLRIAKDDGSGSWLDIGGTGSGFPSGNITSTTNFTNFSYFSLANATGGGNPLPVEWLSFTGYQQGQSVALEWKTGSESNNDYFTILRSATGQDFTEIGTLPGSGNTTRVKDYAFIDERPNQDINYYQIRQTDYDGQSDYSGIIAVRFNGTDREKDKYDLLLYPNPLTGNNLQIRFNEDLPDDVMELNIVDLKGCLMVHRKVNIDNGLELNINRSDIIPGIYLVRIQGKSGIYTGRMIVN